MSIAHSTRRRHLASLVLAAGVGGASSLPAQEPAGFVSQSAPVVVTAAFDGDAWIPADSSIAVTLSRSPSDDEGRIAVVVGTTDLTPLFERTGHSLRFRGRAVRLPAGQSDVILYVVKSGRWTEPVTNAGRATADRLSRWSACCLMNPALIHRSSITLSSLVADSAVAAGASRATVKNDRLPIRRGRRDR